MSRIVNYRGVVLLAAVIVGYFAQPACADESVRRHFGVLIIHSHLDQTTVTEGLEGIVQPPVFDRDHNPYTGWIEWAKNTVTVRGNAPTRVDSRASQSAAPWRYTPTDFTYSPKTDWTYHRRAGKYQPKNNWTYTPTDDWTYHPKRFRSWG